MGDDEETLELFNGWQGQSVSTGRAAKPLSRTPENVTVVTAADIEALNAHTLADVLVTIPGLQLDLRGGVGSVAYTFIQASQFNHVLVLMDGVPLNNLSDNFPDVGLVPVQQIERIEVVKGAASTAWGQALGGVINVITKNPEQGRPVGGTALVSVGGHGTADTRGELSGTPGRLGYYLSGGFLGSNGLFPNNALSSSNGYAKLILDLPNRSSLTSSFSYIQANRGEFASPAFNLKGNDSVRFFYATLGYHRQLSEDLELELNTRYTGREINVLVDRLSDATTVKDVKNHEDVTGASAKLVWRTEHNLLVVGGDYEHAALTCNSTLLPVDFPDRPVNRWGTYLNYTLSFGPLSLSAGERFDRTQSNDDQFSPSLGFTWQLGETTLLRGYTARGYSLRSLQLDRGSEKVWTSQIGIESSAIGLLWLKGTLFRNEIWNIAVSDSQSGAWSSERRIALGTELEMRTAPVLHTSLGAGYTFVDTTRTSDGSQVKDVPRHTVQLALRYDDQRLRAMLTGRHVWWNADPSNNGRYGGMVWDLHLGAMLFKREDTSLELFFSGRNLFNNDQYLINIYPAPGRWFEGGMRIGF
ncbi:ligand-gated TonB-dependent outer membrane channel [Geobacter sp. SVR]|nr:ligand-gated TonB-dependent outer membrane channel [Geobacter sp. SVR]GCF87182.1 ligand-gated TonB-dependent outer membrane channel [Geobacter sp. SVR]